MKLLAMFFSAAFVLLCLPRSSAAPSELDATDRLVLQVDDDRIQAMVRNDSAAVAESLSDQLVYGHSDGRVQTKAQLLQALATNRTQYRAVHYKEREVRRLGDNRAITGVATFRIESNGKPLEFTLRFLAVYVMEGGRWRLAAYQSVQLAQ